MSFSTSAWRALRPSASTDSACGGAIRSPPERVRTSGGRYFPPASTRRSAFCITWLVDDLGMKPAAPAPIAASTVC